MRSYRRLLAAAAATAAVTGSLSTAASASGTPGCAGLPGTSVTVACAAPAVPTTPAADPASVAQVNAVAAGPVDDVLEAVGQGETWYQVRDGLKEFSQNTLIPLVEGVRDLADDPPAPTEIIGDVVDDFREPLQALAYRIREILDGIPPTVG